MNYTNIILLKLSEEPREIDMDLILDYKFDLDSPNVSVNYATWSDTGRELCKEELKDLNENFRDKLYLSFDDTRYLHEKLPYVKRLTADERRKSYENN